MRFDRRAPGGGAEVRCRIENGKAFLEWEFYFLPEAGIDTASGGQGLVRVCLTDAQGNVALEGRKALGEEEPLEAVLLQPRLWRAAKDPHLYGMEAALTDGNGRCIDRIRRQLPLRSIRQTGAGGARELFLNGEAFVPKAVRYALPAQGSEAGWQRVMLEDLRQMLQLGANCVCVREEGEAGSLLLQFLELCDRFGMLALSEGGKESGKESGQESGQESRRESGQGSRQKSGQESRRESVQGSRQESVQESRRESVQGSRRESVQESRRESVQGSRRESVQESRQESGQGYGGIWVCGSDRRIRVQCEEEIPDFRGQENGLFPLGSQCPTSLYYRYRAKWSEAPFIYLAPESVEKLPSGNYAVHCYSNSGRVALYSDGRLFEFQRGEGEYVFREIPAKSPCIMLAAEGDGCSTSLSVQKVLVKEGKT